MGYPRVGAPRHRRLLSLPQLFRKYLTPEERADVIIVAMEAVANTQRNDGCAAAKILETILKYSMPAIGKVAALRDLVTPGHLQDSSLSSPWNVLSPAGRGLGIRIL